MDEIEIIKLDFRYNNCIFHNISHNALNNNAMLYKTTHIKYILHIVNGG